MPCWAAAAAALPGPTAPWTGRQQAWLAAGTPGAAAAHAGSERLAHTCVKAAAQQRVIGCAVLCCAVRWWNVRKLSTALTHRALPRLRALMAAPEARERPQHLRRLLAAPGAHHCRRRRVRDKVEQQQAAGVPARAAGGAALLGRIRCECRQHRHQLRRLERVQLPARLHQQRRRQRQRCGACCCWQHAAPAGAVERPGSTACAHARLVLPARHPTCATMVRQTSGRGL